MTELEREMYKIITEISNANVPIIFKGAMVTKLVLDENEYIEISRGTKDIDANWVGEIPPAEEIEELINNSLSENTTYRAEVYREFSVSPTTLGIRIFNSTTGERVVNMDIDIRPIVGSQLYYYGETTIRGVLPTEIIADKICVISSGLIFRRAKDLIDVYALSNCVDITTEDILRIVEAKERSIGEFNEFLNRVEDLEHAYNRLRGITNKPSFEKVYNHLNEFLTPFINEDRTPRTWRAIQRYWENGTIEDISPTEY